ncbi:MAG: response regulator transcription factor [Deltaproteobacteria bacterium]|nr:response regulator transcription factor [Deltaproteobacteria bacterium]
MKPVRMILTDDHVVLRVGMRSFLEEQQDPPVEVVGEAASGEETIPLVESTKPDLLLLDLSLKGMGGIETTIELRRRNSAVTILVLTQHDEPIFLQRLLEAGANGYILKSARGDELMAAIRAVLAGGTYIDPSLARAVVGMGGQRPVRSEDEGFESLTPRERQVLKLVAEGYSNKETAAALGVAVKTVMTHRFNLMEKVGIHNHAKLVQFAIKMGLLPQP